MTPFLSHQDTTGRENEGAESDQTGSQRLWSWPVALQDFYPTAKTHGGLYLPELTGVPAVCWRLFLRSSPSIDRLQWLGFLSQAQEKSWQIVCCVNARKNKCLGRDSGSMWCVWEYACKKFDIKKIIYHNNNWSHILSTSNHLKVNIIHFVRIRWDW